MTEQRSEKGEAVKAAAEFFKAAYSDAFQPPAKQVGKALETIGRSVNAALLPLSGVVWGFEQIGEFVSSKVSEKLASRNVAPDKIQTPDPDVAVPAVEALRYAKLKDEFASLIATAMNADTAEQVHPGFVEVLKQLSPIDAKLLRHLREKRADVPLIQLVNRNAAGHEQIIVPHIIEASDDSVNQLHGNLSAALDNLSRLGIIYVYTDQFMANEDAYAALMRSPLAIQFPSWQRPNDWQPHVKKGMIRISVYGASFCQACLN